MHFRECLRILIESYDLRLLAIKNDEYLKEQRKDNDNQQEEFIIYEEIIQYDPVSENEEHLDEEIIETQRYFCDFCNHDFDTREQIIIHIQNSHTRSTQLNKFTCKECHIDFKTAKKFAMHKTIHSHFTISREDDSQKEIYKCRLCDKIFNAEDRVREHIYYHKKYKEMKNPDTTLSTSSEALICPHCGKRYKSKQILMQHVKRHTEVEKYPCEKCPSKFKTWNELYYHKSVHTTERNFICQFEECGKSFKAKRDLRNHIKRHETKHIKNFECSHCQLKLKSKFSLERHVLATHLGLKNYNCSHCQKSFAQKTDYNKHLRTHVGENTYNCKTCELSFRLISDLRQHEEIHFLTNK